MGDLQAYGPAGTTGPPWTTTAAPAGVGPALVVTGSALYYQPQYVIGTSNAISNGTLRLTPVWLPACTIDRIFLEFTAAGDAASIFATAVYADNGSFYPGALKLTGPTLSTGSGNAGTITTGGTPGVYQATVSQALTAGWYWLGGAVQGVTVTLPTMRTCSGWGPNCAGTSSLPGTNAVSGAGYSITGVTGALPNPYTAGGTLSDLQTRVGFRVT